MKLDRSVLIAAATRIAVDAWHKTILYQKIQLALWVIRAPGFDCEVFPCCIIFVLSFIPSAGQCHKNPMINLLNVVSSQYKKKKSMCERELLHLE